MTAMTETERRLVTTGFAYLAGSTNGVDARDTWYTARDLTQPAHEHSWVTIATLDRTFLCTYCSWCGQRTEFDQ